jgi:hypothetical protein
MTLILTRTSRRYSLMLTDRKVTQGDAVLDPDANKNVVFADRNAVVAIAYTGLAYIETVPTDQWIVQTLTGLVFPEGRRGRGTVPNFMTKRYEPQYWGLRIRRLRDRLNQVGPLILREYRWSWTDKSFDVLIAGWEWNHGQARPYVASLTKPPRSERFELTTPKRYWHVPRDGHLPFMMSVAPAENITEADLRSLKEAIP